MARRLVALALWAYFGWFFTATLAGPAGLWTDFALLGGVLMGVIALVDWRSRLLPAENADLPTPAIERAEPRSAD